MPDALKFRAVQLAESLIDLVRHNEPNLTGPGMKSAVAERIGEFTVREIALEKGENPPDENAELTRASGEAGFSGKRPTAPGWYWIKYAGKFGASEIVQLSFFGGVLRLVNGGAIGNAPSDIAGAKWCGPIQPPV